MKLGTILMIIGTVIGVIGALTFQWLTLLPIGMLLFIIGLIIMLGGGTVKAVRKVSGDKKRTGRL